MEILYHVINRRDDSVCERAYSPGTDMEKILMEKGIPLFSIESRIPLNEFDIIGFSLQTELSYTNVLSILSLSNIPLRSSLRSEEHPLIIAGGPCTANPEPMADFVDAFVIGEGEDAVGKIVDVFNGYKAAKKGLLKELAKIPGVYVPSFYNAEYNADGTVKAVFPERGIPERVSKLTADFKDYPLFKPIVPFMEAVHDRFNLEIQRGCPRKCRFCSARVFYHPVRFRPLEVLLKTAETGLSSTGHDEISFSSLSPTDYPAIEELSAEMCERYQKKRVSISLPSLRCDGFSVELASSISATKMSNLTFAPEAGTDRMRKIINKDLEEEEILDTIEMANRLGWRNIKLYFMIGLPGERQEDVEGIASLVGRIRKRKGSLGLGITVSPFVPKPHTPFQWAGQDVIKILSQKMGFIRNKIPARIKHYSLEQSLIESVLAKGGQAALGCD